jgi:ATP-dependent DNA helicase Rep
LTGLNPQQKAAIHYLDGPLLILAGAGSGKTTIITHKIASLIRDNGIPAERIAAITFTNKAARDMRSSVSDLLPGVNCQGLIISTFQSLGLQILRNHATEIGLKSNFTIYGDNDSQQLIDELMRRYSPDDQDHGRRIRKQISLWKNAGIAATDGSASETRWPELASFAWEIYQRYEQHLYAANAIDFDDLVLKPVFLFRYSPLSLKHWQKTIQYLLVDEYEDTDRCQHEFVRLLVGESGHLTVAGDEDQSIFGWRGARPMNLKDLIEDFPALNIIKLEQNYRSRGRIIKSANKLIANNPHFFNKVLWCDHAHGPLVRILQGRSEEHEAEQVIMELLDHKFRHNTDFRDYAILFRRNRQSQIFEQILQEHRIPYVLSGIHSFFDRTEVKDILAYLRLMANPDDDTAFLRVINTPRREIGPATLERLTVYAERSGVSLSRAAHDPRLIAELTPHSATTLKNFSQWLGDSVTDVPGSNPTQIACNMLADIRYEDWLRETSNDPQIAKQRMQNVLELIAWLDRIVRQSDQPLSFDTMVSNLCLEAILEAGAEQALSDSVSLMTIHSAKGLEFPHVFITGMEEGLLPHHSALPQPALEEEDPSGDEVQEQIWIGTVIEADPDKSLALQEERRIAYVGITRARESLTLSLASARKHRGERRITLPSRFLKELPAEDLDQRRTDPPHPPGRGVERGSVYLANLRALRSGNTCDTG